MAENRSGWLHDCSISAASASGGPVGLAVTVKGHVLQQGDTVTLLLA
jgi:hypothetical protein